MARRLIGAAQFLAHLFEFLGVSGKAAIGAATFTFLLLAIYATLAKRDIPSGVMTGFITLWGTYTVNRTYKDHIESQKGSPDDPDK